MPQKSQPPSTTQSKAAGRGNAGSYDSNELLRSYDEVVERDVKDLSEAAKIVEDAMFGPVAKAIRDSSS